MQLAQYVQVGVFENCGLEVSVANRNSHLGTSCADIKLP